MTDFHNDSVNVMDFGISQRALTIASSTALDESTRSLDESALEEYNDDEGGGRGDGSYSRSRVGGGDYS